MSTYLQTTLNQTHCLIPLDQLLILQTLLRRHGLSWPEPTYCGTGTYLVSRDPATRYSKSRPKPGGNGPRTDDHRRNASSAKRDAQRVFSPAERTFGTSNRSQQSNRRPQRNHSGSSRPNERVVRGNQRTFERSAAPNRTNSFGFNGLASRDLLDASELRRRESERTFGRFYAANHYSPSANYPYRSARRTV